MAAAGRAIAVLTKRLRDVFIVELKIQDRDDLAETGSGNSYKHYESRQFMHPTLNEYLRVHPAKIGVLPPKTLPEIDLLF